jgi:hypothetical protein
VEEGTSKSKEITIAVIGDGVISESAFNDVYSKIAKNYSVITFVVTNSKIGRFVAKKACELGQRIIVTGSSVVSDNLNDMGKKIYEINREIVNSAELTLLFKDNYPYESTKGIIRYMRNKKLSFVIIESTKWRSKNIVKLF